MNKQHSQSIPNRVGLIDPDEENFRSRASTFVVQPDVESVPVISDISLADQTDEQMIEMQATKKGHGISSSSIDLEMDDDGPTQHMSAKKLVEGETQDKKCSQVGED